MKKHILFLPLILLFTSCADKDRNLTSSDVIGCRMMELTGNTTIITAPLGILVQKTGNLFKDEEDQRDLKTVCNSVRYGSKKVKEEEEKEKEDNQEITDEVTSIKNIEEAQKEELENQKLAQEQKEENVKGVSNE